MDTKLDELIYMAHPVAGDVVNNIAKAKTWLRALQDAFPNKCFIAPWITDVEIYDDANPAMRAAGLERCRFTLDRCDAIVMCGSVHSSGMMMERDHMLDQGKRAILITAIDNIPAFVSVFAP